jgi:hemoglobin
MTEVLLPTGLVEARRTPLFDHESVPVPLARSHRTTVWATLHVEAGSVRYADLEGAERRDERLDAGDAIVIPPDVEHQVEPSTDAEFYVQFHREPTAPLVPQQPVEPPHALYRDAPWEHRGQDLDSPEEIFEMVTRQYADVVQDDVLAPHFSHVVEWQALIGSISDYWDHVLLYAPSYDIDTIEHHHQLHGSAPFTPEAFDRWLQIFHDTVEGGWSGPNAEIAKKRGTGMAWAMANRLLGRGAWKPAQHRGD